MSELLFQQLRENETMRARACEAIIGKVVDNRDPEKLSRVKVSFPTLPGEDASWWAPVVSLGAGEQRGWYFLPEIDDEVVVMFTHGDRRRPVVIGALWNGVDTPPEQNGGSNERSVIVSRQGSRIEFDDDNGTVTLSDGAGLGKIVISKENTISLEASSGDVCIQAPNGELNIVANEVQINGSRNLHLEAQSGIDMGCGGDLSLKGGSMLKVAGQSVDVNSGGVTGPDGGQAECEEVPDPLERRPV